MGPPGKHSLKNCSSETAPRTAGEKKTRYPLGRVPGRPVPKGTVGKHNAGAVSQAGSGGGRACASEPCFTGTGCAL